MPHLADDRYAIFEGLFRIGVREDSNWNDARTGGPHHVRAFGRVCGHEAGAAGSFHWPWLGDDPASPAVLPVSFHGVPSGGAVYRYTCGVAAPRGDFVWESREVVVVDWRVMVRRLA